MVLNDVTSFSTNIPLEETIEIILRRVYFDQEISTNIPEKEAKELLHLCTKNVHNIFNSEIYIQIDGVAMGSPLGPVLANIFMFELEKILIPKIVKEVKFWRRFVDDTICFAKMDS